MFRHYYENGSSRGQRLIRVIGTVVGGIFLAIALALVLGWLIQFLWNTTLAVIFGIPLITYWQAVGLFILAKLFFSLGHFANHDRKPRKIEEKWHHWAGAGPDEEGGWPGKAADFKQYWETEGKQAFADYVEHRKEQKDQEQE